MNKTDKATSEQNSLVFLAGGGEMGERIRAFDWSGTPLGPVEDWPQNLLSALSICLNSNFPIALYWGHDLALLYNDSWSPIPGEKHPWALGRPAREAWSDIWDIIAPLFEQVMTTGEATRRRDQLLPMRRHGFTEECYFDYTFSPVRGEGGKVEGVFNAVIETTSRVIGERRLRMLRQLSGWETGEARSPEEVFKTAARTVAENPHDLPFALFYQMGEDGRVVSLAAWSGLDQGTPASPATVDPNNPDCPWPFREVAESGKAAEVGNLPAKFGPLPGGAWPEPPLRAIVLPMAKPGQSQLAGFVVAGISSRLAFDDDYRGFLGLMAGHVAAAVSNARAYEEEKRRAEALAELDRAKTAFFSNVSHEFRTPLTLMLGPVEDLLARSHTDLTPAAAGQLEVVNRNGLRLLRLVNSLLDFSRIEAGRVRAVYQPTDLATFTADLASNFRSACERAGLRLAVDCQSLGDPAFVDREMWEKIVLNLISNAFKFTFDGEIAVSMKRVGNAAELSVKDTGTGIPAEEMPKLFERFHRIENARGRTHEGSGIGLALVQELVKLHDGSVTTMSEVGKGTTFTVIVPLGSAHLPSDQIGNGPRDGRNSASTGTGATPYVEEALRWLPDEGRDEGRNELPTYRELLPTPHRRALRAEDDDRPRVLVADDNADMRQYVARLLAEQFRVEAVPDGEAALAAARDQPPDLILTDVMMPRLNGFGLLKELRADPRTSGLPVIMLSARAGEESRVEGMEAGADDYLVKPFSARELLARVSAHLQMARMRREATESLRESEGRFRALVGATSDVVYRMSADWTEMRHLVGREFITDTHEPSQSWLEKYIHPDDQRHVLEVIREAIRTKNVFQLEHRVLRVGGTLGWTFSRAVPLLDKSGDVIEWFGAASDVTARKQTEGALQQERDRLRVTLASIGDGVITTDAEGNVAFLNGVAEALTGWTTDEATGRPLDSVFRIVNEATRQPVESPAARALRDGTIVGLANHTVLISKDGTERPIDDSAAPVRDGEGHVVGCVLVFRDISERRQAELSLRESEERAAFVRRSSGVGFWYCDLPFDVLQWDELVKSHFHLPPDAIVTIQTFYDRIHPDDREPTRRAIERSIAERTTYDTEYCTVHPHTGAVKWVRAIGRTFYAADGTPTRFDGVTLDVTEQKEAATAVRESELRYRLVGQAANDAIWDWDLVTDKVTWNEGVRRLFGYTEDQVGSGAAWRIDHIHSDDRDRITHDIQATIGGGEEFWQDEYRYRRADGSYAAVLDRGKVVRDGGRPVRMVGSMLDLTERKRLENDLASELAATTRLHALSTRLLSAADLPTALDDVLENAILTCGADFGNIQLFNSRAEALEIVAQRGFRADFLDYFRTVRVDEGSCCAQAMESGERIIIEDVRLDPTYERHLGIAAAAGYRAVVSTPLKAHDGTIVGMLSTHFRSPHRVSERDGRLLDLYARHAADLIERLRLMNELRQVAAALSEADRRKDEFLATLAHELRNPLAPIRNALQIVKLSGQRRHREEARALMERQVEQMVRLVDDLMDVSRITRGKLELRRERVQLSAVVSSAVDTSRPLLEGMGHHLTVTLPKHPVAVDADPTRLAQVFANLLTNAAKYSERGGKVWLTVGRNGSDVAVSIKDTGIGIPADKLDSIFDMFTQVDRSLEKAQGGLGIGLTLVRRLVEMHGGRVVAKSEGPGKGSEFVVRLPVVVEAAAPPTAEREEVAPRSALRILIVDDNRDGADSLGMMLRIMGNDTHTAYDGQEGLEEARRFRPDVILLDIGMPKLNGYEACRHIRAQPWGKTVILIALTGWGQEEDRRRSHEAGFDHHMVKPVDPQALMKLLAGVSEAQSK